MVLETQMIATQMKKANYITAFLTLVAMSLGLAQEQPTEILLVGFDHLAQMDNGTPTSNIFSSKKQGEIQKLTQKLAQFSPEMVMVEEEPNEQAQLDSLYALYAKNQLDLSKIENGSSELYQVGFRLAKQLDLHGVTGINHYEYTPQSLLASGKNIEIFKNGLGSLVQVARPLKKQVQADSLSIYDYIKTMNQPELVALSHRALFNLPAYVMDGEFSQSGTNTVDQGSIDNHYIGAEYISLFYNRNLKIYSNILNAQRTEHPKRIVLLMGQLHIGVLQDLLEENPNFKIIDVSTYLN